MLKKNDIITLKIEDITNLGFGVSRHGGIVVFVSDTIPGDEIKAKVIKVKDSYAVARCESYLKRSPLYDGTRCDNAKCRSCAYKSLSYSDELKLKRTTVKSAFDKAGLHGIEVGEVFASPLTVGYRNKAQYPVSKDSQGNIVIGFYAPKSHNVCDACDCPLAPAEFADILKLLKAKIKEYGISVYDEKSGTGLLRHIYLRRSESSGEILLTLVVNGTSLPHEETLTEDIRAHFPSVCGILLNVNEADTNVILGDKWITLFGKDYITDTLCDVKLKITAPSFYQVNRSVAEAIYKKAFSLADLSKNDTLLDLYCGAGSIGLSMARSVKELIGIEIIESAVECAKENAIANGINNAKFFVGDAKNTEKLLAHAESELKRKIRPDVVILDPPRAGCDEALIEFVSRLSPKRIVYISCNPQTLARDAVRFANFGYGCDKVFGYDMFPLTGHVESLVCLQRQTN